MDAYGITPEAMAKSDDLEPYLKSWHRGLLDGMRSSLDWQENNATFIELPEQPKTLSHHANQPRGKP